MPGRLTPDPYDPVDYAWRHHHPRVPLPPALHRAGAFCDRVGISGSQPLDLRPCLLTHLP